MTAGSFDRLVKVRDTLGPHYGSEHLCMLLYVLARRERPDVVVELGTGLGASTVWIAAALEENGHGHLWSIDNGEHYHRMPAEMLDRAARVLEVDRGDSLHEFAQGLVEAHGLGHRVTLVNETIDLTASAQGRVDWPFLDRPVDWVFSDFQHGPRDVEDLLSTFLPSAAECFSLFVDSASTLTPSFLVAERMVDQLNRGKVPRAFLDVVDEARRARLLEVVAQRELELTHLVEKRNQAQNSTMWIKTFPNDWRPYPTTLMRGRG